MSKNKTEDVVTQAAQQTRALLTKVRSMHDYTGGHLALHQVADGLNQLIVLFKDNGIDTEGGKQETVKAEVKSVDESTQPEQPLDISEAVKQADESARASMEETKPSIKAEEVPAVSEKLKAVKEPVKKEVIAKPTLKKVDTGNTGKKK